MARDLGPTLRPRRFHQAVARENGAIGSDDHWLLLAVHPQRLAQNRQLALRVAAVVSGVGLERIEGPPLGSQVKVGARIVLCCDLLLCCHRCHSVP